MSICSASIKIEFYQIRESSCYCRSPPIVSPYHTKPIQRQPKSRPSSHRKYPQVRLRRFVVYIIRLVQSFSPSSYIAWRRLGGWTRRVLSVCLIIYRIYSGSYPTYVLKWREAQGTTSYSYINIAFFDRLYRRRNTKTYYFPECSEVISQWNETKQNAGFVSVSNSTNSFLLWKETVDCDDDRWYDSFGTSLSRSECQSASWIGLDSTFTPFVKYPLSEARNEMTRKNELNRMRVAECIITCALFSENPGREAVRMNVQHST